MLDCLDVCFHESRTVRELVPYRRYLRRHRIPMVTSSCNSCAAHSHGIDGHSLRWDSSLVTSCIMQYRSYLGRHPLTQADCDRCHAICDLHEASLKRGFHAPPVDSPEVKALYRLEPAGAWVQHVRQHVAGDWVYQGRPLLALPDNQHRYAMAPYTPLLVVTGWGSAGKGRPAYSLCSLLGVLESLGVPHYHPNIAQDFTHEVVGDEFTLRHSRQYGYSQVLPATAVNHGATYVRLSLPSKITIGATGRSDFMSFCGLLTNGLRQGTRVAGHASLVRVSGNVSRQFLAVIHGDVWDAEAFNWSSASRQTNPRLLRIFGQCLGFGYRQLCRWHRYKASLVDEMGCTRPEDFVIEMDRYIDPSSYHRALDMQRIYETMRPVSREYVDGDLLRTLVVMQEVSVLSEFLKEVFRKL